MFILNSLAPIFLLIALGKVLQKSGFLPDSFFRGMNRLVFWITLPALLIRSISEAALDLATISRIVLVLTIGTLLAAVLAWLAAKRLRLSPPRTGAFIQGAFRGNGAFISLPVIIYSMGTLDSRAEPLATVVLAPVVILFNIIGVWVLVHYSRENKGKALSLPALAVEMLKNPLIASCLIGMVLNAFNLHLPRFLSVSLEALGRSSLPLALLSIGASLEIERLRGAASPSLMASLIKVVAAPLFGFMLAGLFGLSPVERMIAVFYLAAPAAVMSYVMAEEMGNDGPLAGRIVTLSTLLSAVTIPIIMAFGL